MKTCLLWNFYCYLSSVFPLLNSLLCSFRMHSTYQLVDWMFQTLLLLMTWECCRYYVWLLARTRQLVVLVRQQWTNLCSRLVRFSLKPNSNLCFGISCWIHPVLNISLCWIFGILNNYIPSFADYRSLKENNQLVTSLSDRSDCYLIISLNVELK